MTLHHPTRYTAHVEKSWLGIIKLVVMSQNLKKECGDFHGEEVAKRALARFLKRGMTMAWTAWRGLVHENKCNKRKVERAMKTILDRTRIQAFRSWKEKVDENKRVRAFMTRMLGSALRYTFDSWLDFVDLCAEEREIKLRKFLFMMKHRMAFACFYALRSNKDDMKKLRNFMGKIKNAELLSRWLIWKEMVAQSKGLKDRVGRLLEGMLESRFRQWTEFVELCHEEKEEKMRNFLFRMKFRVAVGCFERWKDLWEKTKATTLMQNRARGFVAMRFTRLLRQKAVRNDRRRQKVETAVLLRIREEVHLEVVEWMNSKKGKTQLTTACKYLRKERKKGGARHGEAGTGGTAAEGKEGGDEEGDGDGDGEDEATVPLTKKEKKAQAKKVKAEKREKAKLDRAEKKAALKATRAATKGGKGKGDGGKTKDAKDGEGEDENGEEGEAEDGGDLLRSKSEAEQTDRFNRVFTMFDARLTGVIQADVEHVGEFLRIYLNRRLEPEQVQMAIAGLETVVTQAVHRDDSDADLAADSEEGGGGGGGGGRKKSLNTLTKKGQSVRGVKQGELLRWCLSFAPFLPKEGVGKRLVGRFNKWVSYAEERVELFFAIRESCFTIAEDACRTRYVEESHEREEEDDEEEGEGEDIMRERAH